MKKILALVLCCTVLLTACGGQKVRKLTPEDISKYAAQLGEEPAAGEFVLNGIKMTEPLTIQTLIDNRWKFRDGKGKISVQVETFDPSEIKVEDASIYEFHISSLEGKQRNTIVLPKGITLDSTYDEIVDAYGEAQFDYIEETNFIRYVLPGQTKKC